MEKTLKYAIKARNSETMEGQTSCPPLPICGCAGRDPEVITKFIDLTTIPATYEHISLQLADNSGKARDFSESLYLENDPILPPTKYCSDVAQVPE